MVFPVVMYGCESWTVKKMNWCFWTVVLEKTLESPLDCKEIQPAHPKGDQSWVFIGRTDAGAETPILWPSDAKSWPSLKRPWCWERLRRAVGEGEDRGWDSWMYSSSPFHKLWLHLSNCSSQKSWSLTRLISFSHTSYSIHQQILLVLIVRMQTLLITST